MGTNADQPASGIVVTRVCFVDSLGGRPEVQFWAAAVARVDAVEAVRQHMPLNALVELTDIMLTQDRVSRLAMKLGSIREITDVGLDPPLADE